MLSGLVIVLGEPHIDHDNSSRTQNNMVSMSVSIYLSIIYPVFVTPWFPRSMYTLKCSMYSGILTCSCAWFTTALDWTARMTAALSLFQPWRLSTKTGRWMCRHMVQIDSAYRDSGAVAGRQLACLNQKWPMGCWTVYTFMALLAM